MTNNIEKIDTEMKLPKTVGELIEILKQYPEDYSLRVYKRCYYGNGEGEFTELGAASMEIEEFDGLGELDLMFE